MSTYPDVSEAEVEKLLRLMTEADGGQPFMTHKAAATLGAFILAELGKIAQQSETEPNVKQEWGRIGQVAKKYGYTSGRMDDFLLPWVVAGKVRVFTATDPLKGTQTHKLYNLADVAACMEAKS